MPDFAVAIRHKKPEPKEMADRPDLGGGYAGLASRLLAFSIDQFALIIALIIAVVFAWGGISVSNLDTLFQTSSGTHGFGLLRMLGAGVLGSLVACVFTGSSAGRSSADQSVKSSWGCAW
jgi:hypothetical protein